MDRQPDTMAISDLRHQFVDIDFPEYQREPDIWSRDQKQRLIDSILRGFDVASIYLYRRDDNGLECIDGRQRLNAIMSFIGENDADEADNGFPLRIQNEISADLPDEFGELNGQTYEDLEDSDEELARIALAAILDYRLTIVYLSGAHAADEFNLQFLRLNLGTLINAGEKLHAMVGGMRDVVFGEVGSHPFLDQVSIPTRRFAREQVAAQILLQVFARSEKDEFTRARHLDLQRFLKKNAEVTPEHPRIVEVLDTFEVLADYMDALSSHLRNRAITVSLVLLAWEERLYEREDLQRPFIDFFLSFLGRLQWQVGNMKNFAVDDRYPYLVEFQRHLTQASVEKPAVSRRHELLMREWSSWQEKGALTGDEEYSAETGNPPPTTL